jgi:ABC-2 type transport system ATP-binding protein
MIIDAKNIRKEFGTVVAVDGVTFSVNKGWIVGLIGPNGAGKTTLLNILSTLIRPTSGKAKVLGHNLRTGYRKIRKKIGLMPDFFNLYKDLKLHECLDFFARAYDVETITIPRRINEVLDLVGMAEKKNAYVRNLSRGMVQRVGLATILIHEPELLLLDEPASGLDPQARIQLRAILRDLSLRGKTIVISSHILTELSGFCTHIALMDKGKFSYFGQVDQMGVDQNEKVVISVTVIKDSDRAVDLIGGLEFAQLVSRNNNTIMVQMDNDPLTMAQLNAHLVHASLDVIEFKIQQVNIEERFIQIAGRKNIT